MSESTLDIILRSKKSGTGVKDSKDELDDLSKSTSKLGDVAKGAAVAGVGALAAGLSYAVDQALEGERVMRATEQVIRSTGGAAGLTADEIGNMAASMSELTGADDEAIQSAENVMLTFTSIGKDVFPQAMGAALDMSAALGQDLQSSVVQLGKALQDPEKGISALSKVGVNFNETSKDTIKQMLAMNDVAGAQKFILKELNTEFGGMAEALGGTTEGKINKAKNALDNLAASIGEKLLPVLGQAADGAVTLMQWQDKLGAAVEDVNESLLKTAPNWKAYAQGVLGAAVAAGKLTQAQAGQILSGQTITEGMWQYADVTTFLGERGIPLLTQADYNLQVAQDAEIQKWTNAQQAVTRTTEAIVQHSAILGPAELGTLALAEASRQSGKAQEDYTKWLDESSKMSVENIKAAVEGTTAYNNLAASLLGVADAEAKRVLAQHAISGLEEAAKKGVISHDDMAKAIDQVMLRYDIATPKTLAMRDAQKAVDDEFLSGHLPIANYIEAADKIPQLAKDGQISLEDLRSLGISPTTQAVSEQKDEVYNLIDVWGKVPKNVTTTYRIVTEGNAPSGGTSGPARAGGGPVTERVPVTTDEIHREKFVPYQSGSMMPAGTTIGSVTIPIYAQVGQSASEIARAVAIELGRLANIGNITGAGLIGA